MSCNYYLNPIPAECECCRRPFDRLHIGLSANGGYAFTFQAYPAEGLTNAKAWRERIVQAEPGQIIDEYDHVVTTTEMLAVIGTTARHKAPSVAEAQRGEYFDSEGYLFAKYDFC